MSIKAGAIFRPDELWQAGHVDKGSNNKTKIIYGNAPALRIQTLKEALHIHGHAKLPRDAIRNAFA